MAGESGHSRFYGTILTETMPPYPLPAVHPSRLEALKAWTAMGRLERVRKPNLTSISLGEQPVTHPIVSGFTPYKDPRHLYILDKEPGKDRHDFMPLVHGKALKIFDHKEYLPKTQPTVVISETTRRMVYSSTCGADTFLKEPARRLAIQSMFWALGLEGEIPREGLNVDFVRPYATPIDTHLRAGDPHRGRPVDVFSLNPGNSR